MAEPTEEQLKAYAGKLPEVYRTALWAFIQTFDDGAAVRRAGTNVRLSWIESEVREAHPAYHSADVVKILDQLEQRGFVKNLGTQYGDAPVLHDAYCRYAPTVLGERLIAAVTGIEPVPESVPKLPEPVWA